MQIKLNKDPNAKICHFCTDYKTRQDDPTWKIYQSYDPENGNVVIRFCEKCLMEFILRAMSALEI